MSKEAKQELIEEAVEDMEDSHSFLVITGREDYTKGFYVWPPGDEEEEVEPPWIPYAASLVMKARHESEALTDEQFISAIDIEQAQWGKKMPEDYEL